jgi:hypothetical protein
MSNSGTDYTSGWSRGNYCPHCSNPPWQLIYHGGTCPRIKAIEYNSNGTIKRVEFHNWFGRVSDFGVPLTTG